MNFIYRTILTLFILFISYQGFTVQVLKVVWTPTTMYILLKEHPDHLHHQVGRAGLSYPGSVMTVFPFRIYLSS